MAEQNQLEDIISVLVDIRRRLEALETGQRSRRTSISNGALRILDDAGNVVGEFGKRDDGSVGLYFYDASGAEVVALGTIAPSSYGLRVTNAASGLPMFDIDDVGGMSVPVWRLDWLANPGEPSDGNGRKTTTSATWSDLWRIKKAFAFGDQFGINMATYIPVGTTVDLRLTAVELGGSSPVTIWSQTGATSSTVQVFQVVTIPPSATISGTSPVVGRYFNFAFQMQRTSGAGVPGAAPIEESRIYP